jgi:hypothetical protein
MFSENISLDLLKFDWYHKYSIFMGNIDEKTISLLLEKIDSIKAELSVLEEEVKALAVAEEVAPVVEEVAPVPEPVEGPVAEEPAPVAAVGELVEPVEAPAPEPIDITISDFEMPVPPVVEPLPDDLPAGEDIPEEETVADDILDDIPEVIPVPELTSAVPERSRRAEPVEAPVEAPVETRKSILDSAKADTAVMDVMAEKQAWRTDRPGMPVKNIISAISLNDRVLLINVLFREDPLLFQETIAKFNSMGSLGEALAYISENYPEWDMNSEPVYRLMMAVRRKLS